MKPSAGVPRGQLRKWRQSGALHVRHQHAGDVSSALVYRHAWIRLELAKLLKLHPSGNFTSSFPAFFFRCSQGSTLVEAVVPQVPRHDALSIEFFLFFRIDEKTVSQKSILSCFSNHPWFATFEIQCATPRAGTNLQSPNLMSNLYPG